MTVPPGNTTDEDQFVSVTVSPVVPCTSKLTPNDNHAKEEVVTVIVINVIILMHIRDSFQWYSWFVCYIKGSCIGYCYTQATSLYMHM